ncbi:type VI secretion system tip protein VgrG [Azospirillum argentinense]|uniref:Type VI secretion system tip protein VgrG n=1 Tax=Azospirillum argentinense TaxID=2970906 RepID=A0ABW8VCT7_9PROT
MDPSAAIAIASTNRLLTLDTVLGRGATLLTGFSGEEAISSLFRFTLDVVSPRTTIKPEELIGTPVSWSVSAPAGTPRRFHALVQGFDVGAPIEDGQRSYRLEVVPWLWLLTQTTDCRIFQKQSVRDIIRTVLEDHRAASPAVQFDLSGIKGADTTRDYCVQYDESDFAFLSRLAEEEGIFYVFRHEADRHVLVMADGASAYKDLPESRIDMAREGQGWGGITQWVGGYRFRPDRMVQRDFNFETPRTDLTASSNTMLPSMRGAPQERFEYPGGYADLGAGTARAKMRMEEIEAPFLQVSGAGSARHMAPGGRFTLHNHAVAAENGRAYVVTGVRHAATDPKLRSTGGGQATYQNSFDAIPADVAFRPPRVTPRPVMRGPQTAIVVGNSGEEIDCDKHGRVRVQFHWDRLGKRNENSSCWIRVAQLSAGRGWGHQFIPRIGTEVVVDFLDGDPDRPLIVGSVYNGDNPVPYALPDNKTQSGVKTRSSKGGGPADFNELRFEDRKGSEQVYFHAQKDFQRVVEKDDTLEVGNNQTETIKEGNRTVTIEMGNDALTIQQGNQTTKVALGKSECEAMQSIELKVGQSSIRLDQTGVTIRGVMVRIEGQAMTEVKAPMNQVKGDAMVAIKGGLVTIN